MKAASSTLFISLNFANSDAASVWPTITFSQNLHDWINPTGQNTTHYVWGNTFKIYILYFFLLLLQMQLHLQSTVFILISPEFIVTPLGLQRVNLHLINTQYRQVDFQWVIISIHGKTLMGCRMNTTISPDICPPLAFICSFVPTCAVLVWKWASGERRMNGSCVRNVMQALVCH